MRVRQSISTDAGMTWGAVTDTALPNPGASVDAIRTGSGKLVLALNDTIKGRHRLSLAVSTDDGATWSKPKPIENFEPEKGSASYPSILQTSDGRIHVTYSYRSGEPGSSIRHASVSEAWLTTP
jgi:predicted neuraminidase